MSITVKWMQRGALGTKIEHAVRVEGAHRGIQDAVVSTGRYRWLGSIPLGPGSSTRHSIRKEDAEAVTKFVDAVRASGIRQKMPALHGQATLLPGDRAEVAFAGGKKFAVYGSILSSAPQPMRDTLNAAAALYRRLLPET